MQGAALTAARGFRLRIFHLPLVAWLAACATAPVRPSPEAEEIKELRRQLPAQSAPGAQQQRRIEELEVKLAALAARAQPSPAAQPAPPKAEPRPQIKSLKLGEGRR